jgi:hypothetical protein
MVPEILLDQRRNLNNRNPNNLVAALAADCCLGEGETNKEFHRFLVLEKGDPQRMDSLLRMRLALIARASSPKESSPRTVTTRFLLWIIVALAIPAEIAQALAMRSNDSSAESRTDAPLETFKVATDGDFLVIPVRLGTREYLFAFDTGSTVSVLDTSLRSLVGDQLFQTLPTLSADGSIQLFKGPRLAVGKLKPMENLPVGLVDLAPFRELSGHDLRGLLGMDFLRDHIVQIDSDNGTLSVLRSLPDKPGAEVRLSFSGNCPYVEANLAGITDWFLVDTGFSGGVSGMITTQCVNRLLRSGKAEAGGRFFKQATEGKGFEGRVVSVNSFRIGHFDQTDLSFTEGKQNLITALYLMRYIVTFDFPHAKLYLKKSAIYSDPEPEELSGMIFGRLDGKTVVRDVYPSSPAARAGIQPDDVILKIGEKDAEKSRIMELRLLLCDQGRTVPIKLQRAGRELDVSLLLLWRQEDGQAINTAPPKARENGQVEQDSQDQTAPFSRRREFRPFRR